MGTTWSVPARRRGARRGQAEIIGGLIVLTLIFMFAVPVLLNAYYGAQRSSQASREAQLDLTTAYNERLAIGPVPPTELALRAGWIPGVWINNTGTTPVTLSKLYLIDIRNNTIYAIIDLTTARPGTSELIKDILIDVDPTGGTSKAPPPAGTPITLNPGETMLIVFNQTEILPVAGFLVVRVESTRGILHPVLGGGGGGTGEETLLGGRPAPGGTSSLTKSLWRGIFSPQSGFKLVGYDDIVRFSNIWVERPCYRVTFDGRSYYGWAITNDPDHPPYYDLEYYYYWWYQHLRAFLGTFDYSQDDSNDIRVDGWYGGSSGCVVRQTSWSTIFWDKGSYSSNSWKAFTVSDMDSNGVDELTFFTYWIHYYGGSDWNPDSDGDGDARSDSVAGIVQVARDISGVDYVKISIKVIYDISLYGNGEPNNKMKVFSLVVWQYDPDSGSWRIAQAKDFEFVNLGPKVLDVGAVFPVDRSGTYRVGMVFYDPYKRVKSGAYYEFMMGLEHMIVEYGLLNPLFRESPPVYLVAIPDPNLIRGIGEEDYAAAKNLSLDDAKVAALESMVSKIKEELNYAGVAGYTVITTPDKLCELLFGDNPPKYAIVYWLQGEVPLDQVTGLGGCSLDLSGLRRYILTYHWVWVSPYGAPFGDPDATSSTLLSGYARILPGPFNMTITSAGINARKEAYAFYLYPIVNFSMGLVNYTSSIVIQNATFYEYRSELNKYFGTVALWVANRPGEGVLVLNLVHVDWDATGDGALPETVVQQIVYSAMNAWSIIRAAS